MALSALFAENALIRLFFGNSAHSALVLSMTGVKLGERLLVMGLSDPSLLSTLGSKLGITGRACGLDTSGALAQGATRRAERDGVLVEVAQGGYARPPFEPHAFDIVVIRATDELADDGPLSAALDGARESLRDGGRCQVIVNVPQGGMAGRLKRAAPSPSPDHVVALLKTKHLLGARILASRDGLAFVEGVSRTT